MDENEDKDVEERDPEKELSFSSDSDEYGLSVVLDK